MPWVVKKLKNGKYGIFKKDGTKVGESSSKAKAQASVRARYANYKK
jgi:hypothetical protein